MNAIYEELVERIRGEVSDMERVVQRALRAWSQIQRAPGERAYLDSVALNLHGFYSGFERLFELIARHVDRALPASETWHRDLLQQMARDLADVRPAVISQDNALSLDEFRRFRHLVRNVYTMNLAPDKVAGLMSALPGLWPRLRTELLAFADFLEDLAQAGQGSEIALIRNNFQNAGPLWGLVWSFAICHCSLISYVPRPHHRRRRAGVQRRGL